MGFNKLSHLNSQKSGKEVKRLANFVGGGWFCFPSGWCICGWCLTYPPGWSVLHYVSLAAGALTQFSGAFLKCHAGGSCHRAAFCTAALCASLSRAPVEKPQ